MERDPDGPMAEQAMLARFMPMHLLLDREGRVLGAGPTLRRMLQGPGLAGAAGLLLAAGGLGWLGAFLAVGHHLRASRARSRD